MGRANRTCVAADGFPRRALLVGEPEEDRAQTLSWLRERGSEIVTAADGAAALSRLAEAPFDLILVDAQTTGTGGCEATRRIRSWEADTGRRPTPIIGLAAEAPREEAARWLDSGCDALVAKPVDERALSEAIRGCIEDLCIETVAEIADLLPDYLAHRRADIDALWEAIADGNWALARRLGHDMKGSGKLYGLPRVSEIGARLENSGKSSDRREASLAVSSLESFIARAARQTGNATATSAATAVTPPRSPSGR